MVPQHWGALTAAVFAVLGCTLAVLAALAVADDLTLGTAIACPIAAGAVVFAYAMHQNRQQSDLRMQSAEIARQQAAEINGLQQALARLQTEVALQEPETGMSNGRLFDREFKRLSALASRHGQPFSLAVVRVGDAFGREDDLSDRTLIAAATMLTRTLRSEDSVCRLSRDEFGILLANTTVAGADAFIERIGFHFSERIKIDGFDAFVTVYGGSVEWEPELVDLQGMVETARADLAAHGATRRRGGKRVEASA